MKNDIDSLINLMKKYTTPSIGKELGEEEAPPSTGDAASSGGGQKSNVTTWSGTVGAGLKRGKANPLGNTVWASGLTRGPANQLT